VKIHRLVAALALVGLLSGCGKGSSGHGTSAGGATDAAAGGATDEAAGGATDAAGGAPDDAAGGATDNAAGRAAGGRTDNAGGATPVAGAGATAGSGGAAPVQVDCAETATESRTRYAAASVAFAEACQSEEQQRHCLGGVWSSWSGNYQEIACHHEGAAACGATPDGGSETRERYASSLVPYSQTCQSEVQSRMCTNGIWGIWSGSFLSASCSSALPQACGALPHGSSESRVRYQDSSVPFGVSCQPETQTRLCSDGAWGSWSGTFGNVNCSTLPAKACGAVPHGNQETRTRFEAAEVFNASCKSESQERSCNDGSWSAWSGSYASEQCAACQDPDHDLHGSGCTLGTDCDETRSDVYQGAPEIPWNYTDEDCDGSLGPHLEIARTFDNENNARFLIDGEYAFQFGSRLEVRRLTNLSQRVARYPWHGWYPILHAGVLVQETNDSTVEIYDFRDVSHAPVLMATLSAPGHRRIDLSLDGKRLYITLAVSNASWGTDFPISRYDLSQLNAPAPLSALTIPHPCASDEVPSLADTGSHLLFDCNCNAGQAHRCVFQASPSESPNPNFVLLKAINNFPTIDYGSIERDILIEEADTYSYVYHRIDWSQPQPSVVKVGQSSYLGVTTSDGIWAHEDGPVGSDGKLCFHSFDQKVSACPLQTSPLLLTDGRRLLVGADTVVRAYDAAAPQNPPSLGTWERLQVQETGSLDRHLIDHGKAYLAAWQSLAIADLQGNAAPIITEITPNAAGVALENGIAYVLGNRATIVDTRSAPFAAAPWENFANDELVVGSPGDRLLVSARSGSLVGWNLDDPLHPGYVTQAIQPVLANNRRLASDSKYLYLLTDWGTSSRISVWPAGRSYGLNQVRAFAAGHAQTFVARGGKLYWIDGTSVYASDRESGQTVNTYGIPLGASYNAFWDAGPALFAADNRIGLPKSLGAINELTGRIDPVELPAGLTGSMLVAGEGWLLVNTYEQIVVLRIAQ